MYPNIWNNTNAIEICICKKFKYTSLVTLYDQLMALSFMINRREQAGKEQFFFLIIGEWI